MLGLANRRFHREQDLRPEGHKSIRAIVSEKSSVAWNPFRWVETLLCELHMGLTHHKRPRAGLTAVGSFPHVDAVAVEGMAFVSESDFEKEACSRFHRNEG